MTPQRAEPAAATRVEPAAFDVDGTTLVGDLHLAASSAQDRSPAPLSQSALESFRPSAVTLSVLDLEGTARWYREKLGFREVKRRRSGVRHPWELEEPRPGSAFPLRPRPGRNADPVHRTLALRNAEFATEEK